MKFHALVLATLVAGCGDDGGGTTVDAAPRPDAPPTCPPQTAPLSPGDHEVFVEFEGVSLTLGDCDDAVTNCTSLVSDATTMVPPFLMGVGNRDSRITTITGMVRDALAPFSVDVVTTRPASGDYWMVVVGGSAETITGTANILMAAKPVCDATNRKSIALVFEYDDETTDRAYANTIAGAFGSLAGLVPTTLSSDCMCVTATCAHQQACTFGTGSVTMPGNACQRTTQNEQGLLQTAVGCR